MFVKKCYPLLLLLLCSPLFSAPKIVSVATLGDYAPLLFSINNQVIRSTLEPGEDTPYFDGYSWDIFRESLHIMGYTIQLKVEPWARALKEFEAGEVDLLFPAGKNKKRLAKFNYSQQAINEAHFVIYINTTDSIQWHGLTSLIGLKIGVIRGYNYGNKWNDTKGISKVYVKNIITGFEMLEKGRLDGFVGYEFNWDYHLNKQGWVGKFQKLANLGSTNEYVVALKNNKQGQQLLNDFDLGKQKLINNGRFQAIALKWSQSLHKNINQ